MMSMNGKDCMKMKNRYIFICLMALSAVFACERVEEISQPDQEQSAVEKVSMTFSAVIESDKTKTALVEGEENGVKKVVWQPGDAIAVSPYLTMQASLPSEYWKDGKIQTPVEKFVSTLATSDAESEFEGIVEIAASYKAFYPYSETIIDWGDSIYFDIPDVQKYVKGTFDPQAAPMVATASYGQAFDFQNLCGILAFKLVGTESVKSISFSALDYSSSPIPLAGRYRVNPNSLDYWIYPDENLKYSVTLETDEPVVLDPVTPKMFYMMLPPGTYHTFTLTIVTEEGVMVRVGNTPITLERAHLKPTGVLEYVETVEVDLSERGHSNCYIVSEPGFYSFDATVIGNGEYGFVDGVDFHVSTPEISPASVDLIWEDRNGLIRDVKLNETKDRVKFTATGIEGNALVAVKDASGNILWSWHLWMTDKPNDLVYVNHIGSYTMLDRNIGAISTEQSQWRESVGVMYQWGRKDPFSITGNDYSNYKQNYTTEMGRVPLSQTIENPSVFYCKYPSWTSPFNSSLWAPDQKTIYDPCPVGYRVPPRNAFRSFTKSGESTWQGVDYINVIENFDKGWNFIYDGVNTTYFPTADAINYNGDFSGFEQNDSDYWTADCTESDSRAYKFRYYFYSYVDAHVTFDDTEYVTTGYPVRCMKDDGFVDLAYAQITLNGPGEVSTTSATFFGNVTYEGSSSVTDAGIIWGTTCDLTLESAIGVKNVGAGNIGFGTGIDGLSSATRYFVRAYAINKYGVAYSDVISFYTKWDDSTVSHLSINGTSNCYLVPPISAGYSIDVDVIGNGAAGLLNDHGFHTSNPSITPADVELLWQDQENVISYLSYSNGMAYFLVTGTEGNAVIAARDVNDNIIWSWHIWVTDDPAEQIYNTNEGKTFSVMDRNLGSISAVMGENGGSLYYQWGRKDPFRLNEMYELVKINTNPFSYMSEAIAAPTTHPTGGDYWVLNHSPQFWSKSVKTIYDPCPVGWKVPGSEIWSGMRTLLDCDGQENRAYAYGVVFGFADSDHFWYPDTPRFDSTGAREGGYTDDSTELWAAEDGISCFLNYNSNSTQTRSRIDCHPVRCVKDE